MGMDFVVMIRRPPRSTLSSASAASDVYKRQLDDDALMGMAMGMEFDDLMAFEDDQMFGLAVINVCEATRLMSN